MKKGAVQLSAGFLVTLILSMMVFGIGVLLVRQIFTDANDVIADLDGQKESQIRASLKDSNIVSLPFSRLTLKRGQKSVTGIGILNKLGSRNTFYVGGVCTAVLAEDGRERICDVSSNNPCDGTADKPACSDWITTEGDLILENNRDLVSNIFFIVPKGAPSGNYIFNVGVCAGEECPQGLLENPSQSGLSHLLYGTLQKFYLNMP